MNVQGYKVVCICIVSILLAIVASAATINISKFAGNQSESFVVINPTNPLNVVAFSNEASSNNTFRAYSFDGGVTWTKGDINVGAACCDGQAVAFDSFGNLFLVYIDNTLGKIQLINSTNGGVSFSAPTTVGTGGIDQPSLAAGNGSIWVDWNSGGNMVARGAPVSGLGTFGPFAALQSIPSASGSFGGIAVGPGAGGTGKVIVVYQSPTSGQGPATIFANVDPDGLGASGFGSRITITSTNVGGFDFIPAQNGRSIDAECGVAWDATGGTFNNRIYLVYVDETPDESNNTDIMVRTSDNDGTTWSAAKKVNDDATTRSQFNPYISLDETSGAIGVTFHDCRNDNGTLGTNGVANDDAQYFATFSTDGGATFAANTQLSCGFSNAADAANGIDYGDYVGTDTYCGVVFGVWADNSNCTGDNPAGTLNSFDLNAKSLSFGALDLSITKTDGGISASAGQTIVYTIGYQNQGKRVSSGVVLNETVPANTTFKSSSSTAGWVCLPNSSAGSTCTFSVGLVAGCVGSGSVNFAVTVDNPLGGGVTQISNTASVSDDGTNGSDSNLTNNSATETTPITGGCPTITLNDTLPDGALGTPYSGTVVASGSAGPFTYAVTSGSIPTNLGLSSGGSLSGTPSANGTFNFDVTATDTITNCAGTRSYTVVIGCIFCDDFGSADLQTSFGPWTMQPSGSYSASTGDAVGTTARKAELFSPDFGKCTNCTFEAHMKVQSTGRISLFAWLGDKSHFVELRLYQDKQKVMLKQKSGTLGKKASVSFTLAGNQTYDVAVTFNGTNFQVSIDGVPIPGLTITKIATPTGNAKFRVKSTTKTTITGTIESISVF